MENTSYAKDLADIRNIMEQSTRFLSLSGKSGIFAGIFALIASYLAWQILYDGTPYLTRELINFVPKMVMVKLAILAGSTLVASIGVGYFFTHKKAQKNGVDLWRKSTWRLMEALAIPLVTGGILSLILLMKGLIGLIAPITLIFYGLALVNASKHTLNDIKFLGISEIIVGLLATYFIGYGLMFWAVGFGLLHIVYGTTMHFKYDRKH